MISPQRQAPPRRRSLLGLLMPQWTTDDSIKQEETTVKSRSLPRRRSIALTTTNDSLMKQEETTIKSRSLPRRRSIALTTTNDSLTKQEETTIKSRSLPRRRSINLTIAEDSLKQQEMIKPRTLPRRRSISLTASFHRGGKTASAEDEELSVTTSSTCTSNLTNLTTTTVTTTTKKCVRFASDDKNEYYENDQLCLEECQELWISRHEYHKFHESLKFLSTGLERAEMFAADNPTSYTNVLLYVYALCSDQTRAFNNRSSSSSHGGNTAIILKEDEMQELTHRLRLSSNRLGLERRIIPQFRQERYSQRSQMLQQIQQIQNQHHNNSGSSRKHQGNNITAAAAVTAAHIRQACESISRPSRLFSLHMAHALAATV